MVTETLTCVAKDDCSSEAWSSLVPKRVCVVNVMRAQPVPSVGRASIALRPQKYTRHLHLHQQGHGCQAFVPIGCICPGSLSNSRTLFPGPLSVSRVICEKEQQERIK